MLNIKSLALRMHGEGPKRITLTSSGPGEITAGMIEATHDIEIIDPDIVICTLDDGAMAPSSSVQITISGSMISMS